MIPDILFLYNVIWYKVSGDKNGLQPFLAALFGISDEKYPFFKNVFLYPQSNLDFLNANSL